MMNLNWRRTDYFTFLVNVHDNRKSQAAIELLIDDLHSDKNATLTHLLGHCGSEDILWGIVRLLASSNQRLEECVVFSQLSSSIYKLYAQKQIYAETDII